MIKMLLKYLLGLMMMFAASSLSMAQTIAVQDSIPSFRTSILVDMQGTLTIDQVRAMQFMPRDGIISQGYTSSITWVKMEIAPSKLGPLLLNVWPTYLDDIRLFSPKSDGNWQEQRLGDHYPYTQRKRTELAYSFDVSPELEKPLTLYLRLQTTSTTALRLKLMTPSQSLQSDANLHLGVGLYCGFFALLSLTALTRSILIRDRIWLAGAFFQLGSILQILMQFGFAARYMWPQNPEMPDILIGYSSVLQFTAGTLFIYFILKSYKPHWLTLLPYPFVIYGAVPLVIYLSATHHIQESMRLNSLMILFLPLWSLVAVWFITPQDRLLRYLIRGNHFLFAVYLVFYILPFLGVNDFTDLQIQSGWVFNFILSLMGFWILLRRDQLRIAQGKQALLDVVQAKQQLAFEQARLTESSNFMSMLLHELKTPLAVIKLAAFSLGKSHARSVIDATEPKSIHTSVSNIDQVLERVQATDQLEHEQLQLRPTLGDVTPLIETWIAEKVQASRVRSQLSGTIIVNMDTTVLRLMVKNLLDNALKYSPPDSPVQLSIGTDATYWWIRVENEAGQTGLPDTEHLFQKYYRAEKAHAHTGIGLGLYWVRGVARQTGGDVTYSTTPTGNIVFELRLPC